MCIGVVCARVLRARGCCVREVGLASKMFPYSYSHSWYLSVFNSADRQHHSNTIEETA